MMKSFQAVVFAITIGACSLSSHAPLWAQVNVNSIPAPVSGGYSGVSPMPWFGNQVMQSQLQLTDQQVNQLNVGYHQSFARYTGAYQGLDKNLPHDQRALKQQELYGSFYKDFSPAVERTFSDPASLQRFQQLDLQYRGYGAFNDSAVIQRLNLTSDQRQKLGQFQNEWIQHMTKWNQYVGDSPTSVLKGFNKARSEIFDNISNILTPEQLGIWSGMIGDPFIFPPEVYFPIQPAANGLVIPAL
jgi:hypothetical protein